MDYISQLIRYSRTCGYSHDFLDRGLLLRRTLLNQWFLSHNFEIFCSRHDEVVDRYRIWRWICPVLSSVMTHHLVYNSNKCQYVLLTLLEHRVHRGVCVAQSLFFSIDHWFFVAIVLSVIHQLLITPLVFSKTREVISFCILNSLIFLKTTWNKK